jgi:hypothetical protein
MSTVRVTLSASDLQKYHEINAIVPGGKNAAATYQLWRSKKYSKCCGKRSEGSVELLDIYVNCIEGVKDLEHQVARLSHERRQ